jgi:putative endonuclease
MNDVPGETDHEEVLQYLKAHGFQILDQRWQTPDGWLDIIAVEHNVLVVVDPRRRSSRLAEMSQAKRTKVRQLGVAWMTAHGRRFEQIRIDVVGLIREGTGGLTIEHVRGVG